MLEHQDRRSPAAPSETIFVAFRRRLSPPAFPINPSISPLQRRLVNTSLIADEDNGKDRLTRLGRGDEFF
jgi:hypothetical protein